jgi:lycopene cyclase CruP
MLAGNFAAMEGLGDPVMKPFLQDVIQFGPLLQTMGAQMVRDPLSIPGLIMHVGPGPLADWVSHVAALGAFTALDGVAGPPLAALRRSAALSPQQRYRLARLLEAWQFGSGKDYKL